MHSFTKKNAKMHDFPKFYISKTFPTISCGPFEIKRPVNINSKSLSYMCISLIY